jgi:hypothetical protein
MDMNGGSGGFDVKSLIKHSSLQNKVASASKLLRGSRTA